MNNIVNLKKDYDYLAPDGSEIRLLCSTKKAGLAHCTLPAFCKSQAIKHKTVLELWYFLSGNGEVWKHKHNEKETITSVSPGTSLIIEPNTKFQFKNNSDKPLEFIITTIPAWPGKDEAEMVENHWD